MSRYAWFMQALDEYRMLKEGDRVLVCLSGSSSSLCLLHLLHQFCQVRQLNVDLAAINVGGGERGVDPRALMLYLKELGVPFFYEPLASNEPLVEQLTRHASHRKYNVLAMASTLDKLADRFLTSLLYRGELSALQPVQGPTESAKPLEGDVRIVRPLLFLRESTCEEFATDRRLPCRVSIANPASTDGEGSLRALLHHQEQVNPLVYHNIRNALRPILSLGTETSKSAYEMLRSSLNTRE